MSVNSIKSNDIYISDDLNQSARKKNSRPDTDTIVDKVNLNDKLVSEAKQSNLQRVAQLQKIESQDEELLAEQSKKDMVEEASKVSNAMKTISEFINMPIRTVNFTQDDGSEKTVIKIFDSESNELIKQFPSEEILSIAQKIVELREDVSKKTGILLDESI